MGKNLEFCIFSPWSNLDGKMIFLLGNFITAELRANVFGFSANSSYFGSKKKKKEGKREEKILQTWWFTWPTTLNKSPLYLRAKIYSETQSLCCATHSWWDFRTKTTTHYCPRQSKHKASTLKCDIYLILWTSIHYIHFPIGRYKPATVGF